MCTCTCFHSFKVGFVLVSANMNDGGGRRFPFLQGRLRTNLTACDLAEEFKFPFLQGRLRTRLGALPGRSLPGFPFLQGRLRTKTVEALAAAHSMFPFLQGRLRTENIYKPFRLPLVGFHSFKVGFVHAETEGFELTKPRFHSFKVGFVQWIENFLESGRPRFHSFKVGFVRRKNKKRPKFKKFPFLQGRLRTQMGYVIDAERIFVSIPSR